jgi:hypothetical protein
MHLIQTSQSTPKKPKLNWGLLLKKLQGCLWPRCAAPIIKNLTVKEVKPRNLLQKLLYITKIVLYIPKYYFIPKYLYYHNLFIIISLFIYIFGMIFSHIWWKKRGGGLIRIDSIRFMIPGWTITLTFQIWIKINVNHSNIRIKRLFINICK